MTSTNKETIPTIILNMKATPPILIEYSIRKNKDNVWERDYYFDVREKKYFDFN